MRFGNDCLGDFKVNKQVILKMDRERKAIIDQVNQITIEVSRFTARIKTIDEQLQRWNILDAIFLTLNQDKRNLVKVISQKQEQICKQLASLHKLSQNKQNSKNISSNLSKQNQTRNHKNKHQKSNEKTDKLQVTYSDDHCNQEEIEYVSGEMREQLKAIRQLDAILSEKQQQRKIIKTLIEMQASSLQNTPKKQQAEVQYQIQT